MFSDGNKSIKLNKANSIENLKVRRKVLLNVLEANQNKKGTADVFWGETTTIKVRLVYWQIQLP